MIDALIDDGDVVVIKPGSYGNNGEMVVAWLKEEEEATLKKFYLEGSQVRLQRRTARWTLYIAPQITWKSAGKSYP